MAKYETTYELWYEVRTWAVANGYTFAHQGSEGNDGTAGAAPTTAKNEPVMFVSWRDAIVWCNAYSEKNGMGPVYTYGGAVMDKSKSGFRLPTEVEWEFAARGGNPSDTTNWDYTYAGSNTAEDVAWYNSSTTHPVGEKAPNSLGLYDMSGNAQEWCWDRSETITVNTPEDGAAPQYSNRMYRVFRGGAWRHAAIDVSFRNQTTDTAGIVNDIGFRVVCRPSP